MPQITYQNALDEEGKLVHISEVDIETHLGRIFHCLSCGGEMIAKIGDPNKARFKSSHFAHKHVCDCSEESYLHKLGKLKFKERFDSGAPIIVACPTYKVCPDNQGCPLYDEKVCKVEKEGEFNIRELYDICTEEKECDGFRADLLLESSTNPNRAPLFIEIVKTHKSTPQKIGSKNKIIEIYVSDEYQLDQVISGRFRTDNTCKLINFETKQTGNAPGGCFRLLEHFVLYPSGKAFAETISCRDVYERYNPNSLIEFAIYKPWSELGSPITTHDLGFVLASDFQLNVRNCAFCKYHSVDSYAFSKMSGKLFCKLTYTEKTPSHPDQIEAKECRYYRIDSRKVEKIREKMSEIKYWRLPIK